MKDLEDHRKKGKGGKETVELGGCVRGGSLLTFPLF